MLVGFPSSIYGVSNADDAPSGAALAAREREEITGSRRGGRGGPPSVSIKDLTDPSLLLGVVGNVVGSQLQNQMNDTLANAPGNLLDDFKSPEDKPSDTGSILGDMLQSGDTNSAGSYDTNNWLTEFKTYLDGLMTNQGKENELNRQYNSAEAVLNREFQHNESELQRQWYEQMSNTAYQRSVADLKKAGLNPALAYAQGGAASAATGVPSGSAAMYTATGGDTLSSILSSVADVISSVSGASASKVSTAFKIFKMFGG